MEKLDAILCNWDACAPDGVALPAARIGKVFELVTHQLQEPSLPSSVRTDVAELLSVNGSGLPPLLRLLRVSGSRTNSEVVHFFRFWQTFDEVFRRLRGSGSQGVVEEAQEPLAEEIAEFRDGLLRKLDSSSVTQSMDGFVTKAFIATDIARMRSMSADPASWKMLEAGLRIGGLPPTQQLQLHTMFEAILAWLRMVCAEYVHGQRAAKISCVRHVARCEVREACLHLSTAGWDVESALQSFFAGQAPPGSIAATGTSWSSQGAKLRKDETECPICMHPYTAHDGVSAAGASIQLRCCFQVMCRSCHKKLVNEQHMFNCPFCRVVDHVPQETLRPQQQSARRRSSSLNKFCRTAERLANDACRVLGNVRDELDNVREVVEAVRDELPFGREPSRSRQTRRDAPRQDQQHARRDEYYRTLPRAVLIPPMVPA